MNKPNKKHHPWVMLEPRRIDQIAKWIPYGRNPATVHRTGRGFVKDGFPGCTAPKAPLCKGGCHANSVTGGLFQQVDYHSSISLIDNPPVKNQIDFFQLPLHKGAFSQLSNIAQHHRLSPVVSKCALAMEFVS